MVSDLVRHPQGRIADHVRNVGETKVCTSVVVAAELRYGATKKASQRLSDQLEIVPGALDVVPIEVPVDVLYGRIRAHLEQAGTPIGANDLLIATHALELGATTITDHEREFSRIEGLPLENWLRN